MSTICKKEIRAYLTSMSGYVFIAFMLLVTGIYFTAYHMNMGYPIFGYTLSAVNFIFLIVTPILTMRALAEEQRQKTRSAASDFSAVSNGYRSRKVHGNDRHFCHSGSDHLPLSADHAGLR